MQCWTADFAIGKSVLDRDDTDNGRRTLQRERENINARTRPESNEYALTLPWKRPVLKSSSMQKSTPIVYVRRCVRTLCVRVHITPKWCPHFMYVYNNILCESILLLLWCTTRTVHIILYHTIYNNTPKADITRVCVRRDWYFCLSAHTHTRGHADRPATRAFLVFLHYMYIIFIYYFCMYTL